MYTYKTEILKAKTKVFSYKANEADVEMLDELINKKTKEGWEFVTYDYMSTSTQLHGAFLVTFRKENIF